MSYSFEELKVNSIDTKGGTPLTIGNGNASQVKLLNATINGSIKYC